MNADLFGRLKREVERVFRKKIVSYPDCLQLSEQIYLKTGQRLNVNTLRRCFNLVASPFKPSASTLNVLSLYCGFTSFQHFEFTHKEEEERKEQSPVLSEYLSYILQMVPVENLDDKIYVNFIKNMIIFLERYPDAIDGFQRGIAKTPGGKELYFEHFINVDQLNGYYGRGMRYYLAEKKTPEAQIFGNTILIWRSWLTGCSEEVQYHYEALKSYGIQPSMPPQVVGRYFQGQILWSELTKKEMQEHLDKANEYYCKTVNGSYQIPFFEAVLANALILSKMPEEALFYIEKGKAKLKNLQSKYFNSQIFYAFYLFEAIAFVMMGEKERGAAFLKEVQKSRFYFLAVQYHSILLLVTQKKLGSIGNKEKDLDFLIQQTGFTRLLHLFD